MRQFLHDMEIRLLEWLTKRNLLNQPCLSFGGFCHGDQHVRVCEKSRAHVDSHAYEEWLIGHCVRCTPSRCDGCFYCQQNKR